MLICCRHVAKTGDIKGFVLTEESGIAKGIRRIVAVTGHEAHEVTRVANNLEAKLESIDQLTGKEKDTALKAFTVVSNILDGLPNVGSYNSLQELNQADISVLRKAEIKDKLNTTRKAFDKDIKEKEAALNKLVRVRYRRNVHLLIE